MTKRGRPVKYPQLRNRDWMEANLHRAAFAIADELGCSRSSVTAARSTLSLLSPGGRGNRNRQFPELYEREWVAANCHRTEAELCKELGCSKQSIYLSRRRFGLKSQAPKGGGAPLRLTITDDELRNLLLSGGSVQDIAEEYGVTRQAVYIRATKAGMRARWIWEYRPDTETAEEVAA